MFGLAASSARQALRPFAQFVGSASFWGVAGCQALRESGLPHRRPSAMFFPAYGREGAALLRIYNMASALRSLGWRIHVMPWRFRLNQRLRVLAKLKPDLILMQGARHHLNRPSFYPGHKIVFDMDDADFHLPHLECAVRQSVSEADMIVAGSSYIAEWCRSAGALGTRVVWTAANVSKTSRPLQKHRPPIVAWAQTTPENYSKESDFVLDVMARLTTRMPDVRLRLFDRRKGSDQTFLDRFRAAGISVEWIRSTNYRRYLRSFDDVALGFSPICPQSAFSRGKSFGKILAYLDRHVPVIASDHADHQEFFSSETGVITNDPDIWVDRSAKLLSDPHARQTMAEAAFVEFNSKLSLSSAAVQMDATLREFLIQG